MDKAGDGQLVELEDLCMNRELSFVGFTPQMFMEVSLSVMAWHGLAPLPEVAVMLRLLRGEAPATQ